MGGQGSGQWYRWDTKDTVEGYRSIDVRVWQRKGVLKPGCHFTFTWSRDGEQVASIGARAEHDRVVLNYRYSVAGQDPVSVEYPVLLGWTRCNFGGSRAWFLCPAVGCGRRVAILYASRYFVCRHCLDLTYSSRRENAHQRAARREEKALAKLGDTYPDKPKGMHWHTFERLCAEAEQAEDRSWAAVADWLDRMEARCG